MNLDSTRRAFLIMASGAVPLARGQYVLPPQSPPAERFPPSPQQAAEIARKLGQLQDRLSALQKKNAKDDLLVEVEIFHKAAAWIGRFGEYYGRNCVAQTLALLDTGLARAAELDGGKSSWTSATGAVIRAYRSKVDGSAQPYIAYVPATYNAQQPGRLDVLLHGTNRGMVEVQFMSRTEPNGGSTHSPVEFLQIELLGRTNNAYRWAGEAEVFEAVEAAKRCYAVDETRVILRGFSMGGAGTWHLGLHHPDVWAAIEPGAGFTDTIKYGHMPNLPAHELRTLHIYDSRDYALNLFQLPTAGYAGEIDAQLQGMVNIREELEKTGFTFQLDGLNRTTKDLPVIMLVGPNTPHRWEPESRKRADAFIDEAAKKGRTEPDHIRFTTFTTRYNRCFWVTVDGLERHYDRAEVDARRSKGDGTMQVRTKNVSSIMLGSAGIKTIELDGQSLAASGLAQSPFIKRAGVWKAGADKSLRKRHGLQGPIDDAFLSSFLCVRATGQTSNDLAGRFAQETLDGFSEDFAKFFRGQIRVKDDTAVTDQDIADHNLILFGDPRSNQLMGRVAAKLPIRWDDKQLVVKGKTFDASSHTVAMVFPSPLNPGRYVVLNSGHSFRRAEMAATNAALFPRFGDYAILHLRQPLETQVEADVVTAGYFDEDWKLV